MCLHDGVGALPRDAAKARNIMKELADNGHGWASFSYATMVAKLDSDKTRMDEVYQYYLYVRNAVGDASICDTINQQSC